MGDGYYLVDTEDDEINDGLHYLHQLIVMPFGESEIMVSDKKHAKRFEEKRHAKLFANYVGGRVIKVEELEE